MPGGVAGGSPEKRGEAGGETVGVSCVRSRVVAWFAANVMGVMSVKKVKVMDGFGCSTRGGIPSGENRNERIERWFIWSEERERLTVVVVVQGHLVVANGGHHVRWCDLCEFRGWNTGRSQRDGERSVGGRRWIRRGVTRWRIKA
jgi:hypothetical protein